MKQLITLIGASLLVLGAGRVRADVTYSVTERQPPAGSTQIIGMVDIANDGAAIGDVPDVFQSAYWTNFVRATILKGQGHAGAINNNGSACGYG